MLDVVIATGNRHKFKELKALLTMPGIRWHSLADYPALPPVRETGHTFDANAIKKAQAVARGTRMLAIADDSGLEVEALRGGPGVRSARFAGRHGNDRANNVKVLRLMKGLPPAKRKARYRCSLVLADPLRVVGLSRGTWAGRIATVPRGRHGFGYDPLFMVPRHHKTVGQLSAAIKRQCSHRARAARTLRPILLRYLRLHHEIV